MALKKYQERVLDSVKAYLRVLSEDTSEFATYTAWMRNASLLGLAPIYKPRRNGLNKDFPNICLKVPTGGGKTLLATQVLGTIYDTILRERNGAGLVLWIVPSDQIYKDTLRALRDRHHFYRESLEFAVKRPIEVWEKHEICRITPTQMSSRLNILVLILSSANRQDKETLKLFKDSGGNIIQHFPPEDDLNAQRELRAKWSNLEVIEGTEFVKTSVGNLVRMYEPPVILDEGHKAYSDLAQATINGLDPSVIVELSATPNKESNIICKVTGKELLDEQMIKLPLNIAASSISDWRECLDRARLKRDELEELANSLYLKTGKMIRPIVLVQVERTGKDQRDSHFIHSEDVKEHLIQGCGIHVSNIAIKSSDKDDIEGINLLDEGCQIRFIITKSALQEGWDCPYAYILVSLNNSKSKQSMTQLVGRILRQPHQERLEYDQLNESYVYCLHKDAQTIAREVKKALEDEGYEGDNRQVVVPTAGEDMRPRRTIGLRKEFTERYKDFEGRIYLPRFCVKGDDNLWTPLSYYSHLLTKVSVCTFDYDGITWPVGIELGQAKDYYYRAQLGEDLTKVGESAVELLEIDEVVNGWVLCNLPIEYFSHKQLRTVVDRYIAKVVHTRKDLVGNLSLVKYILRDKICEFIGVQTDIQTQAEFKRLYDAGRLGFFMNSAECRFQIPQNVELKIVRKLNRDSGDALKRSLFEYEEETVMNDYEKAVALYLDEHPEILWWYRNLVGSACFNVQGYKRSPIYPDFVAATQGDPRPKLVCVIESKGAHLAGNEDTLYKEDVASYFDKLGKQVTWDELAKDFQGEIFRFQVLDQGKYEHNWKEQLNALIVSQSSAK